MITLYNTLSRKKEVFKPIKEGHLGIYTCGPTVYWFQHVGNLRTYVFSDILRRMFEYFGYKVTHIINVTDVGHLTSDADSGDDKMELAAKREGKTADEIAKFYFDEFVKDFNRLNIKEPSKWSWASKHIKEQIDLVKRLEEKGFTYLTSDGVYFDTSKFSEYGLLSRKNVEELQGGKRVRLGEKKNKTDFALWKCSGDENRLQEWQSPWGKGFPGWHIECSAMATKYLGTHFDIHTGGVDHIPIHHENEIASMCAFGVKNWVNYWMHGEFLLTGHKKMAKSSGKIKRLSELKVDPLAYRYFTFTAHYRKPLTWSDEALTSAANSYGRLKELIAKANLDELVSDSYLEKFNERIADDLDMPGALAVLWSLLRKKSNKRSGNTVSLKETLQKMDSVFALDLLRVKKVSVPNEILALANKRQEARDNHDWKLSDELRNRLHDKGWSISDSREGFVLEKI